MRLLVAPFAGAWIEMASDAPNFTYDKVAPFTGAWIEMIITNAASGLKSVAPFTGAWIEMRRWRLTAAWILRVAPFTGAWIEISTAMAAIAASACRSLHGSVD